MLQLAGSQSRLHSGAPWWLVRNGLPAFEVSTRTRCQVAIVGAGITGSLVADALTAEGLDVLLIDRRLPGTGSTAVSTALLQYELDTELLALTELVGQADAERAYQLSAAALDDLAALANGLGVDCGFAQRTSLYLASRRRDGKRLQREAEARQQAGLDARWISRPDVDRDFQLPSHGALVTESAAVVDPLRLAGALRDRASIRGAAVMPWTTALSLDRVDGRLHIATDRGVIEADHVVLAVGYEIPPGMQPDSTRLHSTYALVTEPTDQLGALGRDCIVWESARPYTYMRAIDDRVMIGGADLPFRDHLTRDRLLPVQTLRLERELRRLLPDCDALTSYSWAGTFGETKDGMPVIGELSGVPHVYYALGYGGNGITFSAIAARILSDLCLGRSNADAPIFRPDR